MRCRIDDIQTTGANATPGSRFVRDVSDVGDVVCSCTTIVIRIKTVSGAAVGDVVGEDKVMDRSRGVRRSGWETIACTASRRRNFPSFNPPIAFADLHSVRTRTVDFAGIEGRAFEPCDVIPSGAVYCSPLTGTEIGGRIRR